MKALTYDQIAGRKEKAARFVRDVLCDPDRADEIDDEDVEDYAERRKIEIRENPEGNPMTKKELEDYVQSLEAENQDLNERLDQIASLTGTDDEDDDTEDDDQDGDDQDEDDQDDDGQGEDSGE